MGSEHAVAAKEAAPSVEPVAPVSAPALADPVPVPGLAAPVRRQAASADPLGGSEVDAATEQELASASGGRPLDGQLRRSMESQLGTDLADVRLHSDARAARLSDDLQATAFTRGSDVFFSQGALDTSSAQGQHLLAHELTHVAQRKSGRDPGVAGGATTVGRADDPLEAEADATADRVVGALRRQTRHDGCGCGDHR